MKQKRRQPRSGAAGCEGKAAHPLHPTTLLYRKDGKPRRWALLSTYTYCSSRERPKSGSESKGPSLLRPRTDRTCKVKLNETTLTPSEYTPGSDVPLESLAARGKGPA